jgi:hypothetical protein
MTTLLLLFVLFGTILSSQPLACDRLALSPQERRQQEDLVARIKRQISYREAVGEGFKVTLPAAALVDVAQWISLERRCCPFLRFEVRVEKETISLAVDGPPGTRALLSGFAN